MWSHEKIKSRQETGTYTGCYGGGWTQIKFEGYQAFTLEEWSLNSCAMANFHKFDGWQSPKALNDPLTVDALLKYLRENKDVWYHNWRPREYLFLFSANQIKLFKGFIKNPKVKLIDRWANKSHGPNDIYLFRLSEDQDFKKELKIDE